MDPIKSTEESIDLETNQPKDVQDNLDKNKSKDVQNADDLINEDKSDLINNEDKNNENNSIDSIDSNIEFLNEDELNLDDSLENKENINSVNNLNKSKIKSNSGDQQKELDRSHLDLDRSKTSIDDLSFSQRTLIKSCSLKSLITDLINDEILLDKNELSKDLDETDKEKFFQIIKAIKQEDNERKIEQLKDLCKIS